MLGVFIGGSMLAALPLAFAFGGRKQIDRRDIAACAISAAVFAFFFSRASALALTLIFRPLRVHDIWALRAGGHTLLGGLAGALGGSAVYALAARKPLGSLWDALAAPLALTVSVSLLSGFFTGEGLGPVMNEDRLLIPPLAVESFGQYRFALFFFESLAMLAVAGVLLTRRDFPCEGDRMLWCAFLYCALRVITESVRADSVYIGYVRAAQAAAGIGVLAVTGFFFQRALRTRPFSPRPPVLLTGSLLAFAGAFMIMFHEGSSNAAAARLLLTACMVVMAACAAGLCLCSRAARSGRASGDGDAASRPSRSPRHDRNTRPCRKVE